MPMPYTLTKGPLLTLLENTMNPLDAAARQVRDNALIDLRNPQKRITEIPWVTSAAVAGVALPQGSLDLRLEKDWFGRRLVNGQWQDQGPYVAGRTTGYWIGYYGDVESVLREGVIRAIEVSLGIEHGDAPTNATRQWPVNVEWKCPNPYFEVWVTWRRHRASEATQAEQGQVTMLIATPPDKVNRLVTDPRFPPDPPLPRRLQPLPEPTVAETGQGMWLVAHEHHRQGFVDVVMTPDQPDLVDARVDETTTLEPTSPDRWFVPMPTTFWRDEGPVRVVEPPPNAGGADPNASNAPA